MESPSCSNPGCLDVPLEVSKWLGSVGYIPNIPHLSVVYNPFTNHLLNSWDIQVGWDEKKCQVAFGGGRMELGISKNYLVFLPPKSSILIGFSTINHPCSGTPVPLFLETTQLDLTGIDLLVTQKNRQAQSFVV